MHVHLREVLHVPSEVVALHLWRRAVHVVLVVADDKGQLPFRVLTLS